MPTLNRREALALVAASALTGFAHPVHAASATATVATTSGRVRGRLAGEIRVFTGIPYGTALRFRPPRPHPHWADVLDVTQPARVAPQGPGPGAFPGGISEDFLHLNIWTPAAPGPHPVMVYIHGGANESGWSGDDAIAGDRFAEDGIVCVTVNYRLGALGFLELGEVLGPGHSGSGNNAMRDLALALRWVRANIAGFGGNPARVTIAGESAGGKNVGTLMGLPSADGLYSQAALFSGGGQTVHTLDEAHAFARLFVEQLGGADRLFSATAGDIVNAQIAAKAAWPHNFPFRPVVDGHFMPMVPLERIAAGEGRAVPMLIGSNADESRLFLPQSQATAPFNGRVVSNVPVERMTALDAAYARAFPDLSSAERHWLLLTAEEYGIPCLRIAEAHSARGAAVFRYRLAYPAPGGPFQGLSPHALDVPLTFDHLNLPGMASFYGLSSADRPMADAMHGAMVSFVRQGRPTSPGLPPWPRYEAKVRATMVLDRTSQVVPDPDRVERELWAAS